MHRFQVFPDADSASPAASALEALGQFQKAAREVVQVVQPQLNPTTGSTYPVAPVQKGLLIHVAGLREIFVQTLERETRALHSFELAYRN